MIKLAQTGFAVAYAIVIAIAIASCTVGSDKCGKGYIEKMGACQKASIADDSEDKDANIDGSFDESESELVTGLGDECKSQSDCADKEADYCVMDPMMGVGICTIKDCTTPDNNCPQGYRCCELPEEQNYPPICLSLDIIDMLDDLGFCAK